MPWSIPGHSRVTQGSLDTKAIFLMLVTTIIVFNTFASLL
jgi:hypothetical protein